MNIMTKMELDKQVGEDLKNFIEVVINDDDTNKPSKSEISKTFDTDDKRFVATLSVVETEKYDQKDV